MNILTAIMMSSAAIAAVVTMSAAKPRPILNPNLKFHPNLDSIFSVNKPWCGNPLINNRYIHPDYPFTLTFKDFRKWKKRINPQLEFKKQDTFELPVASNLTWLQNDSVDGITWLGHATFFIRINGKSIITDPVFGNASRMLKRYSKFPIPADSLQNIDYVLLSHDHRDHMDYLSIRQLSEVNSSAQYLCGLGTTKLLKRFNRNGIIQEAGWYQQYQLDDLNIHITYLPTRHWCRRWITDTNKRLWGAFVIEINGKVIYFGGDSGYGKHYAETRKLFPNIDLAILGIGAYKPEWFMESNHASPMKAFQSFVDLGAKYMAPMHYGTFDLSDETLGEPAEVLKQVALENKMTDRILMPSLGQNILFLMHEIDSKNINQ